MYCNALLKAILIIALHASLANSVNAQALNFNAQHHFPVLNNPSKLKKSDLNLDGLIDIVSINEGNISILLNQGGEFNEIRNYSFTLHWLFDAELGDYNGDNIPDLFISYNNDSIAVLINSGTGLFTLTHRFKVGTSPMSMAAADFNRDGRTDLAVVNNVSTDIYIFINSSGGFIAPVKYPIGHGTAIQTGDFNNDENIDIAVVNVDEHNFSILINNGNGSFENPVSYATKEYPISIVVRDIDHDEVDDIVIGHVNHGVSIYRSTQNSFSLHAEYDVGSSGNILCHLASGDFNNDGKCDIAVLDYNNNSLWVLKNTGNGEFDEAVNYDVGVQPRSLIAADFNNDGKIDLASASVLHHISLLQNKGDGTFYSQKRYGPGYPYSITSGDFNGDNSIDLAIVNIHVGTISVLVNDQSGKFPQMSEYPVGKSPRIIKSGDFNHDMILDLVVVNSEDNNISVLTGTGNGSFTSAVYYAVGEYPAGLVIADINQDDKLDLVTTNARGNSISFLLNSGEGFEPAMHLDTGMPPSEISAGDLNQDGFPDLVVSYHYPYFILNFMLNNGDGTFANPINLQIEKNFVRSVMVRDFTSDGIADIALTRENEFLIYPNSGNAEFESRLIFQVGSGASNISVGDFNADGKKDVAFANLSGNSVSILLADNQNGFHNTRYFNVQRFPHSMVAGNFNGDEKDDLAVVGWPLNYLTVLVSLPTLTVTARDTTRTYGEANPPFKSNIEGLKNDDLIDITYKTTANTMSHVGEYEIIPTPDQTTLSNYAVVTTNGTLSVTRAPLQITAKDTTRMFGAPNPIFKGVVEGVLNNDNIFISYSTSANFNSPVGEYQIIPHLDWGGENYDPTYISGILTITPVVGVESGDLLLPYTPYPNPCNGSISINFSEPSSANYEIQDCKGKIISKGELSQGKNLIEVSPVNGLYILKLSNGVVRKIIVE